MIGELIGNYRITRKLGEGGMGSVYEGTHEQLGRRVAIKVLTQGLWADEENLGRFFNEARAANIIQHPGVVSIHEYGRTPNQDAYIVMEFLEGESLAARMFKPPQQPLPLRFVYYVTRQIAATLTAVHEKGIYHRELTAPTENGKFPFPKASASSQR